jgi:pyrroline-5-carboxylate reductase
MSVARLAELLGPSHGYVRAMPNINAAVFAGMTVWYAESTVPPPHCTIVERLLGGIGALLRVEKEALIDAATAVSASGPGYVFYIIEHMVRAAERLGFGPPAAHQLVAETLAGSVAMWRASPLTPPELRALVTSKGGTTAAAIEVFEKGSLGEILEAGIVRADERCRELARSV